MPLTSDRDSIPNFATIPILFTDSIANEDYTFPFLRHIVIGCAKSGHIHLIADCLVVCDYLFLDRTAKHTTQTLDILANNEIRLQLIHNLNHIAIKRVARIVHNSIPGHAESLTRETSNNYAEAFALKPLPHDAIQI